MQREIKFRAWVEKKTKKYDWQKTYDGFMTDIFSFTDFDGSYFCPDGIYIEDMTIMQYTGLKKIYEGDIVEVKKRGYISVVVFYKGGFYGKNDKDKTRVLLSIFAHECEIIGNIYQNPGLLKDNN